MVLDEVLVKKVQAGDLAAYGELVSRHQDQVYGLAARMLATPEDARDAAQEIFIKVFRSLPGFNFQANFTTWLYRVATNVCLDLLRRQTKEQRHNISLEGCQAGGCQIKDTGPGPEDIVLEQESLKELKRAVDALPEGYRVALVLHQYQRLSHRQIAGIMDLSEQAVAVRIHRAKQMLRKMLSGGEGNALPKSKKPDGQVSSWKMSAL